MIFPHIPTLYGVDIKITPEGRPYIVEINGGNVGMGGFAKLYGDDRVKNEVIAGLERIADSKLILIGGSYTKLRRNQREGIQEKSHVDYRPPDPRLDELRYHIRTSPCARHLSSDELHAEQKDNTSLFDTKFLEYEQFEHEHLSDCIFIYNTSDLSFPLETTEENLRLVAVEGIFRNVHGDIIGGEIPIDEVGLLFDRWGQMNGLMRPGFPIINPPHHNIASSNKLFAHHILTRAGMDEYLPNTLPVGFGIETADQYWDFIDSFSSPYVVQKQILGGGGFGVHILEKDFVNGPFGLGIKESILLEDILLELGSLEECKYGFQLLCEFIESKPIHSWETGLYHDGCMRAIVFDGTFIDAYWRLAPQPLGLAAPPDKLYRANLSRGAIAEEVSDADKVLVKELCEVAIGLFDSEILKWYRNQPNEMQSDLWYQIIGEKHGMSDMTQKDLANRIDDIRKTCYTHFTKMCRALDQVREGI